jgi:hypothetical protein
MPPLDARLSDKAIFTGGLNTVSDPAALGPNQARQLVNARLTTYGSATRRGGTRKILAAAVGTTATRNVGIYWPKFEKVCVVAGSTQKLYTATAPASFTTTWSMTMDAGTVFKALSLALFQDTTTEILYGESQAGGLYKWDGTTSTNVTAGTPVSVNGICVANARLWGWNSTASSTSIYYSALNNGDTLGVAASGGGQINLTEGGITDEPIIACAPLGSSLMIFPQTGIHRLTGFGESDLSVVPQPATKDLRICGQQAIDSFHNALWVQTTQGLYQVTEGSAVPVGTPETPDPTIAAIAASTSANLTIVYANAATLEIWVIIPGTGTYCYNLLLGAWSGPWNGAIFASSAPSIPFPIRETTLDIKQRTVMPPDANGLMWELDSPDWFTDSADADGTNGTAYTMTVQARRLFTEKRDISKAWRYVNVTALLTASATAPTCVVQSMLGGASTSTFNTPIAAQSIYYQPGGGTGPWQDVTINDAASAQSEYLMIEAQAFPLGRR